jgi:hypothetical protein
MEPTQDDIIKIGDQEYVRTRVTASMKLVKEDELPDGVAKANKSTASQFHWQDGVNPDLVWTQFVLDSEGANKNWDYMPREALIKYHATAKYKPFDMEHVIEEVDSMMYMDKKYPPVKNTIFGVMTHASLADAEGKLLDTKAVADLDKSDLVREKSDRLTVVGWAALYNFLFPKTVAGVLTSAEDGIMRVSMERWIREYDFLYKESDGTLKAIARKEAEANGYADSWAKKEMVNGYPIWRRSLAFVYGGVASTTNPANPMAGFLEHSESVVKAAASVQLTDAHRKLLERHSEIHREFAISTDDNRKQALISEHAWIHQCLSQMDG